MCRIAEQFGITVTSLTRSSGGFSGAAVYRVMSDDQRQFAIRCTPADSALPRERLQALHLLLAGLQNAGLRTVAVPLPHRLQSLVWLPDHRTDNPAFTPFSQTVLQLHGNLWQVEPWLPGEAISHFPNPAELQSALQELWKFHQCAAAEVQREPNNDWFSVAVQHSPGILRRRGIARELSGGLLTEFRRRFSDDADLRFRELALRVCAVLEHWLPWISTRLEAVAGCTFRLQPVIRDLWSAHILFTDDDVSGLIDLSSMATDHVCYDVSRLFRSWFGASQDNLRNAIAEFENLRPLDSSERLLLQAVDAATVLLSPVTWLRRRFTTGMCSPVDTSIIARLTELTRVAEQFEPL